MTGLRKRIVEIPEHEYVDLMITFVYMAKGGERSTATERGFYVASKRINLTNYEKQSRLQ